MRLPRRPHGRHARPRLKGGAAHTAAQVLLPPEQPLRPMRGYLRRAGLRMLARTLVAAVVLIGLANLTTKADVPATPAATPPPSPAQLHLMRRYDCSQDGFGDGSQPRSALIRDDGDLRVVSFDRGWQVYTGARPHALVAVCHAAPR
jgi:hypothetical protein